MKAYKGRRGKVPPIFNLAHFGGGGQLLPQTDLLLGRISIPSTGFETAIPGERSGLRTTL